MVLPWLSDRRTVRPPNPAEYGSLVSPCPAAFFCKLPAQPAVAFAARRRIFPDPYDANLAESLRFSKEILKLSVR
jgi:hypothetical protein